MPWYNVTMVFSALLDLTSEEMVKPNDAIALIIFLHIACQGKTRVEDRFSRIHVINSRVGSGWNLYIAVGILLGLCLRGIIHVRLWFPSSGYETPTNSISNEGDIGLQHEVPHSYGRPCPIPSNNFCVRIDKLSPQENLDIGPHAAGNGVVNVPPTSGGQGTPHVRPSAAGSGVVNIRAEGGDQSQANARPADGGSAVNVRSPGRGAAVNVRR
ncbi:hypothetical protein BJ878DRAFT_480727 [Calycina marina]|uniref:Uncharacterized protein n=1 Tax=Calycina marina TaxID=1763456 RepID=A0A9P7Z1W4_9HELO|nr:hypothetical protein BJ878DRAFT_480727 [Calycina marina]